MCTAMPNTTLGVLRTAPAGKSPAPVSGQASPAGVWWVP